MIITLGRARKEQATASVAVKLVASLVLGLTFFLSAASIAAAETRTLKLYFVHTREKAEITYKRNGRYLPDGLTKVNRFLRDWRRNEPTKMDPQLLDTIWEVYRASGSRDYIHVISAYRSPATNSMLRSRSKGVAKKSQHTLGKAMDFYLPDVKLARLRNAALKVQAGGVGFYPRSGSPFIHVDVGNVRHWPRMSRRELMAVFPDGRTIHVPTDGKPLPGYQQALAAYEKRKRSGSVAIASAGNRSGGFLSAFFGGGADDEEDTQVAAAPSRAPEVTRKPERQQPATRSASNPGEALPGIAPAQPAPAPQAAPEPEAVPETPETIIAALPARSVPVPLLAIRPQAEIAPAVAATEAATATAAASAAPLPPENIPFAMASADPAQSEAVQPTEVALNIPLPTRRPDFAPVQQVAAIPSVAAVLPQERPEADTGAVALAAVPRPTTGEVALQALLRADAAGAPAAAVPSPARAERAEQAIVLAALPETRQVAVAARPSVPAQTPRATLLASREAGDAGRTLATGVRTTGKASKPSRSDTRPHAKPVVMPAVPATARWALDEEYVKAPAGDAAPSVAYNLVRTAPSAVYTQGFQQGANEGDPNRFTGSAVKFLSVARFGTN